jgi:hypothetical protein
LAARRFLAVKWKINTDRAGCAGAEDVRRCAAGRSAMSIAVSPSIR